MVAPDDIKAAEPGILEFFVRDDPPPINNQPFVGRFSLALCCQTFNILIFHLYFFQRYSFPLAFGLYMLACQFTLVLDGLVSNAFGNNVRNLRKAGYSDGVTLFFAEANLVSSQLIGYVIVVGIVTDPEICTWQYLLDRLAQPTSAIQLLLAVLVNLAVADVLFTASHGLLHKLPALAPLHVFHHCSTQSSWCTNLLFHPIDLSLEFGGPAASLLAMHYLLWQEDQLVLLITYLNFQLWYAWDHDENLQFWHTVHHTYCNASYTIYSPFLGDVDKNILKKLMQERGLLPLNPKKLK